MREDIRAAAGSVATSLLAGGAALTTRVLADEINGQLRAVLRTQFYEPFSRAQVERLLAGLPQVFVSDGECWRLATPRSAQESDHTRVIPFSPIRSDTRLREMHRWQREALERWRRAGRRGIIEAVTGAGKTVLGISAICQHLTSAANRVAIIVPTIELMHQWRQELERVLFVTIGTVGDATCDDLRDCMVVVFVARSAADVLVPQVARLQGCTVLLIADECHRYGAETFARALKWSYGATLGLSATPERSGDDGMASHVFPALGEVVFEYHHDAALKDGVIASFDVLFVGTEFEAMESQKYSQLTTSLHATRGKLFDLYPYLKQAKPFVNAVKILAIQDDDVARAWLAIANERRRLVCKTQGRLDFVSWLAERGALAGRRTLMFHESIADCELLAEALNRHGIRANTHHSELLTHERARILHAFATGAIEVLIAPRTLDEGIDVPDADLAVIVAGSSVKRQSIQRMGRVLRKSKDKPRAQVVRVFLNSGPDDPAQSNNAFARAMLEAHEATVAHWPEDGETVLRFFAGSSRLLVP